MQTKQKIIIIVASVFAVAAIAATTVFILKSTNKVDVEKKTTSSQQSADDLKQQGIRALKDGNSAAAKKLFEQAKAEYIEQDDTTGKIDMEAQIYLIDHPRK